MLKEVGLATEGSQAETEAAQEAEATEAAAGSAGGLALVLHSSVPRAAGRALLQHGTERSRRASAAAGTLTLTLTLTRTRTRTRTLT